MAKKLLGSKIRFTVYDTFFVPAIDKIPALHILDKMPRGTETPQSLYFYVYPDGKEFELIIGDWYGDRSTIEICSCKTYKYGDFDAQIHVLFQQLMRFLLARYPDDEYTRDLLEFIVDENPELKDKQFYKIEDNFSEFKEE